MTNVPKKHPSIDGKIHDNHQSAKRVLQECIQPGKIDDRQQVVLDETPRIPGIPRRHPEPLLKRCQRAYAAAKLDRRAPDDSRQVQPCDPFTAQAQQCAEADKDYEAEMHDDNEVRRDAFDHNSSGRQESGLFLSFVFLLRPASGLAQNVVETVAYNASERLRGDAAMPRFPEASDEQGSR